MDIFAGYKDLDKEDFLEEAETFNNNGNAESGNLGGGVSAEEQIAVDNANADAAETAKQNIKDAVAKVASIIAWDDEAGKNDTSTSDTSGDIDVTGATDKTGVVEGATDSKENDKNVTTELGKQKIPLIEDIAGATEKDVKEDALRNGADADLANKIGKVVGPAKGIESYMANLNKEITEEQNKRKKARLLAFGLALLGGEGMLNALKIANETPFFDDENLNQMLSQRNELMNAVHDEVLLANGLKVRGKKDGYSPPTLKKEIEYLKQQQRDGIIDKDQLAAGIAARVDTVSSDVAATYGKEKAKEDVAESTADLKASTAASKQLGQLERLESALSGVQTGTITGNKWVQNIKGVVQELGGDVNDFEKQEVAQGEINNLLVAKRKELAGQGTITDGENDMLRATLPSLGNTPTANKVFIEIMKMSNKRTQDYVNAWAKASKEERAEGYLRWKAKFIADNQAKWSKESKNALSKFIRPASKAVMDEVEDGTGFKDTNGNAWRRKGDMIYREFSNG